jgi:hypothetical protein
MGLQPIVSAEAHSEPGNAELVVPAETESSFAPEHNIESSDHARLFEPRRMYSMEQRVFEDLEADRLAHFIEPARSDKFRGFDPGILRSILKNIDDDVYEHDRQTYSAMSLFECGSDISLSRPLQAWDKVDPRGNLLLGKRWFELEAGERANHSLTCHAPITAALREMLGTKDGQPLELTTDLMELSFSDVHSALINWFVFDLLKDKLDIYHLPAMKPLRAIVAAAAEFGNESAFQLLSMI